jgi:hypothetical protein
MLRVQCVPLPPAGMVLAGMGVVYKFCTWGLPVPNPICIHHHGDKRARRVTTKKQDILGQRQGNNEGQRQQTNVAKSEQCGWMAKTMMPVASSGP